MLTIQIKNGNEEVIATVNNIFSLQVDDEVNKGGKLKLRFPVEKWLQKQPIQKADRISVTYGLKIGKVIRVFEGYITDVTLKSTECVIEAENWLSYLQNRIIKTAKSYTAKPINEVVSEIFTELNTTQELPLSLGYNNCTTQITKDFDVGESFFDILKYCWEAEPKLVARVINVNGFNFLEVSTNGGTVLDGVWEFDVNYTRGTNITDWSWKDSMDEFYSSMQTAQGTTINEEFLQRTKLLFEKYEEEGALSLPSGIALPSIAVSRDTDWWNFNIGDRKNIRLITGYDWLPLEYLGLIQSRKITINATNDIKAEIKISEDYKADTNILDLIINNLRGKKTTSGKAPDLTNYYTKEATNQAINAAISTKANISHTHLVQDITDFAQAVSNFVTNTDLQTILAGYSPIGHTHVIGNIDGLSDALENKANAEHTHDIADIDELEDTLESMQDDIDSKAEATHGHSISDISNLENSLNAKANASSVYTKDEVDAKLDNKSDLNHNHVINDVDGLQPALDNKANKTHSHQISEVDGLQTALNNKADASHTHAISDVNGLETALNNKAAATHSHEITDVNGLQTALGNKADASSVYTKTEIDNKNFIDNTVNNLVNYYTKNETYTKTEIDNKLSQFGSFKRVSALPTTDIKTTVIYLLGPIGTGADQYEEYIYDSDDGWVKIGETSVDLTNYFNKENDSADDIDEGAVHLFMTAAERQKLANQSGTNTGDETTASIKTKLGAVSSTTDGYLTKEDWTKFNNKQDAITDADDINEGTSHKFMTATERTKLAGIEAGAEKNTITGVKGSAESTYRTGNVNITKDNIGLGNVDNTSDLDKPISTAVQAALDNKANSTHTHAISDITNLQTTLDTKADKTQIKTFVITEDIVSVSTDTTKGTAPYNTSYGYTDITIDENAGIEWVEGAVYSFVVNTKMVVASATRNVRVRIGTSGEWKPFYNWTSTILAGSTYFTKANTRLFVYKSIQNTTGELHLLQDTTYSAMSVSEGTTGTATSSRVMRADYLKQIIAYYLQNIDTPTGDNYAVNKKYVDDINTAIQTALDNKASATHTHSQYQLISNMVTSLANADNDHYPTAKAVYDAITQAGGGDMMKTTYDPNNKNADAFDYNNFINTPTIGNAKLTIKDSEGNEVGTFNANATQDSAITLPDSGIDTDAVNALIDIKLGSFDGLFQIKKGLYKILNGIDENDEIGLTEGETWEDIVANAVSMSLISHCYLVMTYISNSEYAMNKIVASEIAAKEVSECWNSISIIAREEQASEIYLGSELGITNLFTYQTAQDAFFTTTAKKTQIINQNIMIIVNSDTLLESLYKDTIVSAAIVSHPNAITTIAGDENKLSIVLDNTAIVNAISTNSTALSEIVSDADVFAVGRTNSTIMTAISTNSSALSTISDSDFFTYILENATYLNSCANSTAGKSKINSYAADDLLPAIYYWTGDLGYSTFAELAASDTAMEIVQGNSNAMKIIKCNSECSSYLSRRYEYQEVEYIKSTATNPGTTSSSGQVIDTGVYATPNTKISIDISFDSLAVQSRLFGVITQNSSYATFCSYINGSSKRARAFKDGEGNWVSSEVAVDTARHTFELDKSGFKIFTNGTQVYSAGNSATPTKNTQHTIPLLCNYDYTVSPNRYTDHSSAKLYGCKIWDNGTLIRDFVPVYRKSDGVIGMIDAVNKVFYTNVGTGSFTKGPDIYTIDDLQYCEYIASTGTQYIDTQQLVNQNYTTEIKCKIDTYKDWNVVMGTRSRSGYSANTYNRYYIRWNGGSANQLQVGRSYNNSVNDYEQYETATYYNQDIHTIKLNRYVYVDGVLVHTFTDNSSTGLFSYAPTLFAQRDPNTNPNPTDFFQGRIYYCKIRDYNGNLVRDFKPCYAKSTGEIGLRDEVNEKFYRNSGSGTFKKGADV